MVAKSGVRKDNGGREALEQRGLIWCEAKLKQFGLAVGFSVCESLVYCFEFAESFGYAGGNFARVRRSGHKGDASRHSCFEADAPANAEDRIEHWAGSTR